MFLLSETKLYASVVFLSAKDNQKLSELFSKWFERSVYLNEYKSKGENKYMKNECRYFFELNSVCFNRFDGFDLFKQKG